MGDLADEADDLQLDTPDAIGQCHGKQDADNQKHVDEGCALRGKDVVRDQVAQATPFGHSEASGQ